MVVIAAETKLALLVGGLLDTPPDCYAFSVEKAEELVREVQPEVLLLDVKLGKSGRRAVESMPTMLLYSPSTAIVVVTKRPRPDEIREATQLGAVGFVDRMALDLAAKINEGVAAARAASRRDRVRALAPRLRALH